MKKIVTPRWLLLVLASCIATTTVISLRLGSNPLRQADADLRARLLAKTPLGSTSNEVRAFLEQQGWHTDGYLTTQPRPATDPFLAGSLGSYQGLPWAVSVSAFWEFDRSNRLAHIRIQRTVDSP
jgi:hypothetical protein